MGTSKRLDVYRNSAPIQGQPVPRAFANKIYCDLSQGHSTPAGSVVCELEEMIIDADYTRVFFAATIAEPYEVPPEGYVGPTNFGMGVVIRDEYSGLRVVPYVNARVEYAAIPVTGALDLPAGVYLWRLEVYSIYNMDGWEVGLVEASLSAIIGQTVIDQHCVLDWGCGA